MAKDQRNFRIPLSEDDERQLGKLLKDVPTKTTVQYVWKSEAGRRFIRELRRVQMSGVPANWIAEALDLSSSALNGAVAYWERASRGRGSRASRQRSTRVSRPSRSSEET